MTGGIYFYQVVLSREDLVVSVQNPDGSLIVEHADGTRITSMSQNRPPGTQHMLRTGEQHRILTEVTLYNHTVARQSELSTCVCFTFRRSA